MVDRRSRRWLAVARLAAWCWLACLVSACGSMRTVTTASMPLMSGTVPVNDTELFFEERGTGDTVLVFIPGGQVDHRQWDAQVADLSDTYTTLRYDVRGFGRSGPTGQPYSHHEDLRALLDARKHERVVLIGLSLGGRIAVDFCLEYPERVEALVLLGPGLSGYPWLPEQAEMFVEIGEAVARDDALRAAELWLETPYIAPAMEHPDVADRMRELSLANAHVWTRTPSEVPLDPPAYSRLAEIDALTLILVGERDVRDIQLIVEHLDAHIPSSFRIDIPGAGHMLNLEAPERVTAEIREVANSIEMLEAVRRMLKGRRAASCLGDSGTSLANE